MRLWLLCDVTAFYLFPATILSRDIGPAKLNQGLCHKAICTTGNAEF